MLIVIVCGGRRYWNADKVFSVLNDFLRKRGQFVLLQGGANGADSLAKEWCRLIGNRCVEAPALWELYGKRAGMIRNQEMLDAGASVVIAFPGGTGTADMVSRAKKKGIEVIEILDEEYSNE